MAGVHCGGPDPVSGAFPAFHGRPAAILPPLFFPLRRRERNTTGIFWRYSILRSKNHHDLDNKTCAAPKHRHPQLFFLHAIPREQPLISQFIICIFYRAKTLHFCISLPLNKKVLVIAHVFPYCPKYLSEVVCLCPPQHATLVGNFPYAARLSCLAATTPAKVQLALSYGHASSNP